MMKYTLGAIAAAIIAGTAFVQPAEARCMWDGAAWQCWHQPHYGFYRDFDRPHYRHFYGFDRY